MGSNFLRSDLEKIKMSDSLFVYTPSNNDQKIIKVSTKPGMASPYLFRYFCIDNNNQFDKVEYYNKRKRLIKTLYLANYQTLGQKYNYPRFIKMVSERSNITSTITTSQISTARSKVKSIYFTKRFIRSGKYKKIRF